MKLTVTEKTENAVFSRTELKFEIDHTGKQTPSRVDTVRLVAANAKANEDLISINLIKSLFGQGISQGLAHVYKKKEDLEKNERPYILKRATKTAEKSAKADAKEAESAAAGKAPPEATQEETPAEETQAEQPAPTEEKPAEETSAEPKGKPEASE